MCLKAIGFLGVYELMFFALFHKIAKFISVMSLFLVVLSSKSIGPVIIFMKEHVGRSNEDPRPPTPHRRLLVLLLQWKFWFLPCTLGWEAETEYF